MGRRGWYFYQRPGAGRSDTSLGQPDRSAPMDGLRATGDWRLATGDWRPASSDQRTASRRRHNRLSLTGRSGRQRAERTAGRTKRSGPTDGRTDGRSGRSGTRSCDVRVARLLPRRSWPAASRRFVQRYHRHRRRLRRRAVIQRSAELQRPGVTDRTAAPGRPVERREFLPLSEPWLCDNRAYFR